MSTPDQKTLDEGFEAQAKAMREFGYPDVTAEMIAKHHAQWLETGSSGDDVIARFSDSAFEDYPTIFGTREAGQVREDVLKAGRAE